MIRQGEALLDANEADEVEIAETMAAAEDAPEPGDQRAGGVVHEPTAEIPFGMTVSEMTSADYMYVWDNRTGSRSTITKNMLPVQLRKRRDGPGEDGSRIFVGKDPGIVPERGTLLCLLHKDHPNHKVHAEMGFPTCRKSNLRTELDVRTHTQNRHKREWQALETDRTRGIEAEEREVRKSIIAQNTPAPPQPEPVVEVTESPVAEADPLANETLIPTVFTERASFSRTCPRRDCDHVVTADTKAGLSPKMGGHKRKFHPRKQRA